ncbi:unnamed protein product [Thlaspi arvense]|uniref:Uncharacterized protein n=1 Tax=Thlaspi arvense TaxID=13288 RepID=A0AAU9RGB9_THLAR|nr:unnamed protein product [Thlaspi arvense]
MQFLLLQAVPYPALMRCDKPRRVDLYFSSWIIKPVQSRKGDGQLSACEVTLVHYEDMGIPKDVAKLGVRHGCGGLITTKISCEENDESLASSGERKDQTVTVQRHGNGGGIDWKWVVIGGAVAVACGLHKEAIGKALILGAGRRIAGR